MQHVLTLAINPQVPTTLYTKTKNATFFDNKNVFVFKLPPSSTNVFSTIFNGSQNDENSNVTVDSTAHTHIIDTTSSTDFPTHASSRFLRTTNSGGRNTFVAELNSNNTTLVHSTYLNSANKDFDYDIDLNNTKNTYITNKTTSN